MGIDVFALRFLLMNRRDSLGETLCLGRQGIHLSIEDPRAANLAAEHGMTTDQLRNLLGTEFFAETLFKNIGSTSVKSMDISSFEGAEIIHDLNNPVPDELVNRFDCIFDGGTIEHVFNFPVAIQNVKKMLRAGGTYYFINAANNMLGHGLYQFSPEVMWRLFSDEAGFQILDMKTVETNGDGLYVDAPDPEKLGRRNEISLTSSPTYLMMTAIKLDRNEVDDGVYQSDYSRAWSNHDN